MKKMTDNMLSQEEIDMLLKGSYGSLDDAKKNEISEVEKDALGEIGNISMGTAATTLFTLLGQKVTITTPKVSITTMRDIANEYPIPFVVVNVKYKEGLKGSNLLILKSHDVKIITDLMMGGDGTKVDRDINEMDISAISEAMNQMVGSACTSLSELFSNLIDIEPPNAFQIDLNEDNFDIGLFSYDDKIVKISFKMVVGDLLDSEIMQLIPLDFAQRMVEQLLNKDETIKAISDDNTSSVKNDNINNTDSNLKQESVNVDNRSSNNTLNVNVDTNVKGSVKQTPVNVKKFELEEFDSIENKVYNESINLIEDIPIDITVELGRTIRKIGEILEYGPGTIIELDKLLGEPLEIFANGKFIAKGEVVVIDDNFGIRITDIVNPAKRISKI